MRTIDKQKLKELLHYDVDLAIAAYMMNNANKWVSRKDVAKVFGISDSDALFHLRRMRILGWVKLKKQGKALRFKITDWGIKIVKGTLLQLEADKPDLEKNRISFSKRERYYAFLKIFKSLSASHPMGVTQRQLMETWGDYLKKNGVTMIYINPYVTVYSWLKRLEEEGVAIRRVQKINGRKINFWKYVGEDNGQGKD